VRFQFVAKHRGLWPVTWICEVLDVSPSGFYDWLNRPVSLRAQYDELLITDILRSFADSDGTYGVRRG
jgi:putative transposase